MTRVEMKYSSHIKQQVVFTSHIENMDDLVPVEMKLEVSLNFSLNKAILKFQSKKFQK